jgi:hypothetical protein
VDDFDFDSPEEMNALTVAPELLLPNSFDVQLGGLRKEIALVVENADSFSSIITEDQHQNAVKAGQLIQAVTRNVADFYKPIKQAIDQAKQPILDMERIDQEALKTAKEKLSAAIEDYTEREEERAARIQAEAELNPLSGELPLPAITQNTAAVKVKGKVNKTIWKAEVENLGKLVVAVAKGEVPLNMLLANESQLNKRADADREGFQMPGVIAREIKKVHFRI